MLAQLCLVIFKTFSLPWINYALFYLPHFQMWFNNETLFQARTNYGNALDLKKNSKLPQLPKIAQALKIHTLIQTFTSWCLYSCAYLGALSLNRDER